MFYRNILSINMLQLQVFLKKIQHLVLRVIKLKITTIIFIRSPKYLNDKSY